MGIIRKQKHNQPLRIYEILPVVCSQCGGEMEIIAFITEIDPIHRVMNYIGELTRPPQIASARAPPVGDAWSHADSIIGAVPRGAEKHCLPSLAISIQSMGLLILSNSSKTS